MAQRTVAPQPQWVQEHPHWAVDRFQASSFQFVFLEHPRGRTQDWNETDHLIRRIPPRPLWDATSTRYDRQRCAPSSISPPRSPSTTISSARSWSRSLCRDPAARSPAAGIDRHALLPCMRDWMMRAYARRWVNATRMPFTCGRFGTFNGTEPCDLAHHRRPHATHGML